MDVPGELTGESGYVEAERGGVSHQIVGVTRLLRLA
jgi:hypothetical protein